LHVLDFVEIASKVKRCLASGSWSVYLIEELPYLFPSQGSRVKRQPLMKIGEAELLGHDARIQA
jgi:hypothetical protein